MCDQIFRKEITKQLNLQRTIKIPLDKRVEYDILCKEDTELAQLLKQIDELLEQAVKLGDDYDNREGISDTEAKWGNKALRCRFVLGMD